MRYTVWHNVKLLQMKLGIITLGCAFDYLVWCNRFYSIQPVWHAHTAFSVTEASGAVGLFVRTQVILPNFICRNCIQGGDDLTSIVIKIPGMISIAHAFGCRVMAFYVGAWLKSIVLCAIITNPGVCSIIQITNDSYMRSLLWNTHPKRYSCRHIYIVVWQSTYCV